MMSKFDQMWDDLQNDFSFTSIKDCSFDEENNNSFD